MDASLMRALQTAKNPEDKAALIAEASLSMFSDEAARVARQCVLFHWFDQSVVEALLQAVPLDAGRAQDVYRQITSLPFIEQLSWGVAYQDLTRQGLLKRYAHTQPELLKSAAQARLVEPETAGDPMSEQKWVRSSLRQLSAHLAAIGHGISPPTVGRLLRRLGYALRVNAKKQEASAAHPERNWQFEYIQAQKQRFEAANCPIISVDTKKKELIGNFKNAGQAWKLQPEAVNVHDFPQDALGKAVPYGIYDLKQNRGTVYVGSSADTPEFAVAALARWWEEEGQVAYPQAQQILILADSGGSNGCRPRQWKQQLQEHFADRYGVSVVVCHYPTGCSKWNPIEHRLFSQLSQNWAGIPLRSFETLLNYIRGTTTQTGLTVRASLLEGEYAKGQKVSDEQMQQLNIEHAEVCSQWNYTLRPRVPVLEEYREPEVIF